jgi:Uma2 family endonuclease
MSDASDAPPTSNPHRLRVDEFDKMVHSGVLGAQDRVELIDGQVVAKAPGDRSYPLTAKQAMLALLRVVPAGWHVASGKPVVASLWDKPEPDLAVVRGQARDYLTRDIPAGDVALAVSISEISLERDRDILARVYASSGIPAYWVLNLVGHQVEVYSKPASGRYESREDYQFGQELPLLVQGIDVGPIPVEDVLP